MKREITYLDLFSGAGGFAKGLLRAGFKFKKQYFSEIDKHAIANYQYQFQNAISLGNIKNIRASQIERPDILTFGSPCQDISLAGKRKGLNGKRSGLFFEALRLIEQLQPDVFIFENVKGLLSSNQGKDFETVLGAFTDIGLYDLQWQLVNTRWFLPQNRERLFLVGLLREKSGCAVFPLGQSSFLSQTRPETGQEHQADKNETQIVSTITSNYSKGVHARGETYLNGITIPVNTKKGYQIAHTGDSVNISYLNAENKRGRVAKGVSHTLTTQGHLCTPINGKLRKLTPLECERLQGYPDNWSRKGVYDGEIKDISDTQRYHLMGNSISVPVVTAIAKNFCRKSKNKTLFGIDEQPYQKDKKVMDTTENKPEVFLDGIPENQHTREIKVPEIKLQYSFEANKNFPAKISSSKDCEAALRQVFDPDTLQLAESFNVLYLNRANKIIGYYRHSIGGISQATVEPRLVLAVAIQCAASSIIISHNHPSGALHPSEADIQITQKIKELTKIHNITLLEHLILTKDGYYSFADEGRLSGIPNPEIISEKESFVNAVENSLTTGIKQDNRMVAKLAASFNITDKTDIKELTELAIVNVCRRIALSNETPQEKYQKIVSVYTHQVILSHRTSQSILLQQYSTPAPIAYLMGLYCGLPDLKKNGGFALEPSAGNGLLTIAAAPSQVIVNEIDPTRHRNLETQGFYKVLNQNGVNPFTNLEHFGKFKAVVTNPPFGVLNDMVNYGGFRITVLDHLMSLRGLDAMANDGKAAIIIGGHTAYDRLGRISQGKNRWFLNYLYRHYNVEDAIPIEGKKLYTRQGTGFPVRLLLINGRKAVPMSAAPLKNPVTSKVVESFEELYDRVTDHLHKHTTQSGTMNTDHINQEADELYRRLMNSGISGIQSDEGINQEQLYTVYKEHKSQHPNEAVLVETPTYFITFDFDAVDLAKTLHKTFLKSKSGNGERILLVLSKLQFVYFTSALNESGIAFHIVSDGRPTDWKRLQWDSLSLINSMPEPDMNGLDSPYTPASNSCVVLNTEVPDSMEHETRAALARMKNEVGGDVDNFVRHRLGYPTQTALCAALSAEQIDAVALAIYNIEAREQGMIIGDQTGIGKGRIAASIIRYAVKQGYKPVFLTEKANLFSDLYRDLIAIGSGHLRPFILNSREDKTDIKDEDGEVLFSAPSQSEQHLIFNSNEFPKAYDFALATYSQFNSVKRGSSKRWFLTAIASGNILIMDESHNASGAGNTGQFFYSIMERTKGVVFLSATFAKRPDNMPVYTHKTAISEANMTSDMLTQAIGKGGVAMQEILSSQLVAEGQMLRRERSFEGVEVNYIQLDEYEAQHRKTSDEITKILRDIIQFQEVYVSKKVNELDAKIAASGKQATKREGTEKAGIDNLPYFSKVFQVINQMLFSIKAEAVAERAIERLKEGKKPVIAFSSTMGSFIEQLPNEKGLPVQDGDTIRLDFALVLKKGLDSVLRYTVIDYDGQSTNLEFDLDELGEGAKQDYKRIVNDIKTVSTGISISPIDTIVQKIEQAGYSVAEVTGRKFSVIPDLDKGTGIISTRKRLTTNDAFRKFNNNEIDVLMINQSGSTGASAHAIVTSKVPKEQVKQRVMIVLQAELDISTEVQKRGRINRTGQIHKPIYDYVTSAIPAEKRLMMLLQRKLKSLDANTTSNQKQSSKILDVPDFLNKYGDLVVEEYLLENYEVNRLLGFPLGMLNVTGGEDSNRRRVYDAAYFVSGRVAVLPTKMQADFYNEINMRYNDYVEYLKQAGEYDLEVEALNLEAETKESAIYVMGKGGESAFGQDSLIETVEVNILRKPYKSAELLALVKESLNGASAEQRTAELQEAYKKALEKTKADDIAETNERYNRLITDIPKEKKIKALIEDHKAFAKAIDERKQELETERTHELELLKKGGGPRQLYIERLIKFFYVGRRLAYSPGKNGEHSVEALALCLGLVIDQKRKNPYALSAIKLKIAVANSIRYLNVPASRSEIIDSLMANSHDLDNSDFDETMMLWEDEIRSKNKSRETRYIVTGNIIQGFQGDGKLVSYTTKNGLVKKGILMPETWKLPDLDKRKVIVPISKTLVLLQALAHDNMLVAGELNFIRKGEDFQLVLPSSRTRGGDLYLDDELLALVNNGKFELHSNKMKAILPLKHLENALEILQRKHSLGMEVNLTQLELIEPGLVRKESRRIQIAPPPSAEQEERERMRLVEIEAEALVLRLRLAA